MLSRVVYPARSLREFLGTMDAQEMQGLGEPIITEILDNGEYVRVLAYTPELSQSDWARCRVDLNGDEEIVASWSRVEYEEKRG